tara:strand:- start:672 stop:2549 length:1878 start_codon:yes stop_codon:yes gene_type:complete
MAEQKICSNKGCSNKFTARSNKKIYCSDKCNRKAYYKRKKQEEASTQMTVSRGEHYEDYVKLYAEKVEKKLIQKQQVAKLLEVSNTIVTKMHEAYKVDKANLKKAEDWETPKEALASLRKFEDFRDRYFKTETGEKYETADFHQKWINAILTAIDEGNEQMILSPPRHGKTDLLTHFAVWQICKNPNVRIMWVGGNEEIAKNAVGSVLDHLEHNQKLIEDFCIPGQTFKPKNRSGKSWTAGQFTVATRTVTGIKSPTMVAVGKGGKILSRDSDLIIADDIEDHGTTIQPSAREQTRQWWTTTLSSRKEEHTAIVIIGSRQHPEDLYNFLLENPQMHKIVEEAHSTECVKPETEFDEHTDCMLWESKRSYKWLYSRLQAAETTGGKSIFEMVYLNKAFAEGIAMFDVEEIDNCRDANRVIGQVPAGVKLIAGLDPASTGYQAAFLWAVNTDTGKMYMIDIENQKGGGIIQARKTIKMWHEKYNLAHWVIEENGFQRAIRQDTELREYCARMGIYLEGHQTQKNKFDPIFGVGSMRELFKEQLISLPYGSAESETKSNIYRRQLIYFSTGASKQSGRNNKSDVVMASWFPMRVVRRLQKERLAEVGLDYKPSFGEWDISSMNEAPWG